MNIVKQKIEFANNLLSLAPKQIKTLFQFGLTVLAFKNIQSLRANSRIANLNWRTAKSKVYRITINRKLPKLFLKIMTYLGIVSRQDIVVADFSGFGNNFNVLMFAKQTRKGRTIPIYFEILKYPIRKDSQNTFVIQAIENFKNIIGFRPKLVFDRGFACPSIVQCLADSKHIFYIRIKKRKTVLIKKSKYAVEELKTNDNLIDAYDNNLRLIVSNKNKDVKEPWYIITNDFKAKRDKIIQRYYYRFEIEEFFRDAKRLLGLEYVNFKKILSLEIILWFTILTCWFMWELEKKMSALDKKLRKAMKLSIIRYFFEMMQREIILAAEEKYLKGG